MRGGKGRASRGKEKRKSGEAEDGKKEADFHVIKFETNSKVK